MIKIFCAGAIVAAAAWTAPADLIHCSGFEQCDAAELLTLDASPRQVSRGDAVTLSWTIPSEASGYQCALTDGAQLLDDAQLRSAQSISYQPGQSVDYLLLCGGPDGQMWSASAAVQVSGNPGRLEPCTAPGPPGIRSYSADYEDVLGPWGDANSGTRAVWRAEGYAELRFTVPADAGPFDRARLKWSGDPQQAQQYRVAVQDCLGAPSAERAISPACIVHTGPPAGNLAIGIAGNASVCIVEPGREYVLAVAFRFRDDSVACDLRTCAWLVEEE